MADQQKIISDNELADLPDDDELAFVVYEQRLRTRTRDLALEEEGSNLERQYINHLLAFIDLYNLGVDVDSDVPWDNVDFWTWYHRFANKIDYHTLEIRLANARSSGTGITTAISFSLDYKIEIQKLLNKIKKVVNTTDLTEDKKDAIYEKIAALQLEVDRTRTRFDALFSRWLDFTNVVGESAENLEPLAKVIERLLRTFGRAKADNDRGELPPPPEPEKLPAPDGGDVGGGDLDDDIPF